MRTVYRSRVNRVREKNFFIYKEKKKLVKFEEAVLELFQIVLFCHNLKQLNMLTAEVVKNQVLYWKTWTTTIIYSLYGMTISSVTLNNMQYLVIKERHYFYQTFLDCCRFIFYASTLSYSASLAVLYQIQEYEILNFCCHFI